MCFQIINGLNGPFLFVSRGMYNLLDIEKNRGSVNVVMNHTLENGEYEEITTDSSREDITDRDHASVMELAHHLEKALLDEGSPIRMLLNEEWFQNASKETQVLEMRPTIQEVISVLIVNAKRKIKGSMAAPQNFVGLAARIRLSTQETPEAILRRLGIQQKNLHVSFVKNVVDLS